MMQNEVRIFKINLNKLNLPEQHCSKTNGICILEKKQICENTRFSTVKHLNKIHHNIHIMNKR